MQHRNCVEVHKYENTCGMCCGVPSEAARPASESVMQEFRGWRERSPGKFALMTRLQLDEGIGTY